VYGSNRYYDDDLDDLEPPPAPREPVGSRY
jgi:hypothetical protein